MKKHYYILLLLLPISVFTQAQTKDSVVTRNVTVEREYVPVVKNAGKVTSSPQVVESKETKTEAQYTNFNIPLSINSTVYALPPARLIQSDKQVKDGFVQIGIGTYPNTLLDFAYPLVKNSDTQLDFILRHRGAFGYELYSKSIAGLQFNKQFESIKFFMGINGGHDYFSYYGKEFDETLTAKPKNQDPEKETMLRAGIFVGFQSAEEPDEWHYGAKLGYDLFNIADVSEHTIGINGRLSAAFQEDRIGADIKLQSMVYTGTAGVPNLWDNYSVLMLNPYYMLQRGENWSLRLGLKVAFATGEGRTVNPSPDVHFDWQVAPDWLGFYAGLTGDYKVNSQNSILAENPYLSFDTPQIGGTYTPFEFFAGVKIKPSANFMMDIFANLRYLDNQYLFKNKIITDEQDPSLAPTDTIYTNRFNAIQATATHFRIGGRLNYTYQNRLNIQLKGIYNSWDVQNNHLYAWQKPAFEMDFSTSFNATKELAFSLNVFYESERHAKLGNHIATMKQKVDVNVGASYTYLDWLTIFAKANNLLNSKYENFYGYQVQGLNAMVGAAISF